MSVEASFSGKLYAKTALEYGSRIGARWPWAWEQVHGNWPPRPEARRRWYMSRTAAEEVDRASWIETEGVEGDSAAGDMPKDWRRAMLLGVEQGSFIARCEEGFRQAAAYRLGDLVMVTMLHDNDLIVPQGGSSLHLAMRVGREVPQVALGEFNLKNREFAGLHIGAEVFGIVDVEKPPILAEDVRQQYPGAVLL